MFAVAVGAGIPKVVVGAPATVTGGVVGDVDVPLVLVVVVVVDVVVVVGVSGVVVVDGATVVVVEGTELVAARVATTRNGRVLAFFAPFFALAVLGTFAVFAAVNTFNAFDAVAAVDAVDVFAVGRTLPLSDPATALGVINTNAMNGAINSAMSGVFALALARLALAGVGMSVSERVGVLSTT